MALDKKMIDDLFDIPRDGSNINSEDTIEIKSQGNSDFNTKIAELNNLVGVELEKTAENVNNIKEEIKNEVKEQVKIQSNIADAIPSGPVKESVKIKTEISITETTVKSKVPEVTESPEIVDKEDDTIEDEKPESNLEVLKFGNTKLFKFKNGSHSWNFDAPSARYEPFYKEKKEVVTGLLASGEIPFSSFYAELHKVSIDINVDSYNLEKMNQKINDINKWRDRIKFIQLNINSQYFGFKAFDELLKGVLARTEYIRGKQEGLVYEHMSDFVKYMSDLEGLYRSVESVNKHLDSAFASLSRQFAIANPFGMETDRSSNNTAQIKPMTKELSGFDSLQSMNQSVKTSNVVSSHNPNSVTKSAESSLKSWNI